MRRRSLVFWLILLLIAAFIVSQLFLPYFAAGKLRNILEQETDSITSLDIELTSFPALEILTGHVDRINIISTGFEVDHLYLDNFEVRYRNIKLREGGFSGKNTRLKVVITENALNDYISYKYPDLKNFILHITPSQILMQGSINFLGTDLNAKLSGNFIINDRQDIYFVPDDFQIENLEIPVNFLKNYLEKLNFFFNFKGLNIPLNISEITMSSGFIVIRGGEMEKGGVN